MRFVKMHGLGNDHVLVEMAEFNAAVNLAAEMGFSRPAFVRRICDRRYGVGGDGLLVVGESQVADISMLTFNLDGTQAEMCGNGIRCVGKYAVEHGLVCAEDVTVETASGVHDLRLSVIDGSVVSVRVNMGVPRLPESGVGGCALCDGDVVPFTHVSMGNPHAVVFSDAAVETVPLDRLAGAVGSRRDIFPDGTNVEVVHVEDYCRSLQLRVYERGCGETAACGTGACAAAVAYQLRCGSRCSNGPLEIRMDGGSLSVEWEGSGQPVYMTGPAEQVFTGEVDVRELLASMS